jgi:subtilisin family serine protease
MKRKHLLSIILIIALSISATGGMAKSASKKQPEATELAEHVPGEILIRFSPGVNSAQAVDHMSDMGVTHKREISAIGVHLVKLPPGLSVEKAMDLFSRRPGVEFVEPNYILKVQAPSKLAVDELEQWALEKIEAPLAWDEFGTDPNEPLLAIVDTGITPDHPDLANNMWENPGETGLDAQEADKRFNGLDDDGNGYVDDWQGWDFVNNDNEPLDDQMHGTAVSSVAAAEENEIGVVGVCPWCQLLGVKVLDSTGSGNLDVVAEGIIYAADMDARVINLSLGAGSGAQTLADAVTYAWSSGALVSAGAGNNGARMLFYPAAYPEAMAVASTDEEDYHSCFSNYSPDFISVAAPGAGVIVADITNQETGYGYYNGTSLSAPHVTGLAGLLFSQDPGRTNDEVRSIIEDSAVDLGPQGFDDGFGQGRIDAYRAVTGDFSQVTPPDGLFSGNDTATGYAHARKLVRVQGDPDSLHMIWHTKEEGPNYRIRYANSTDDGATWNLQPDVFSSPNETYHSALATDGEYLFAAIPSKTGPEPEALYQILFTRKLLPDGDWEAAVPIMGGNVHTVRPDMYFDPTNDRLHVIASSLDDAPDLYYRGYDTQTDTWGDLKPFNPSNSTQNTRYATLHANGGNIFVVARTIALFCIGQTCYPLASYIHSARSTDGGANWDDNNKMQISSFQSLTPTDYGISLAGVGDRLYLGYEVGRNMYFRRYDGAWSDYLELETSYAEPDPSNPLFTITYSYKWPTITQAENGQAWLMYEEHKESALYGVLDKKQYMRHFVGGTWSETESMGSGTYANFKLGTSADRLEWVSTQCNGAPFFIEYDWLSPEPPEPPQPQSHHIPLASGWNLVSFNLIPADTSIDVVLGSIAGSYDLVFAWDGATQTWQMYDPTGPAYSNTLQNLDQKRGFWIYANFPVILTVTGTPHTTTDIPVYSASSGWNLVGYPSVVVRDLPGALQDHGVGIDFSLVYAYQSNDPADPWKLFDRATPPFSNDLTSMTPGLGYWIKVSADNTWQVNYLGP